MTWVAGADSCRAGWFVVLRETETGATRRRVVPTVEALLALPEQPVVLGIDMIIGLPDAAERGGRACDRAARKRLGWPRSSSVFSPLVRSALQAATYREALALNRASSPAGIGLTIEAFNLFPKIRALDAALTPTLQATVHEVHPELSFYAMQSGEAVAASKHADEGRAVRVALLERAGWPDLAEALETHRGGGVKPDDILDAHAACWSAARIAAGTAQRLPEGPPPTDARGLCMTIAF